VDKSSTNTSSSLNLTYTADGTAQFSSSDADAGSELVDAISWDPAIGEPSAGSALLEMPFSASNQSFSVSSALSAPLNLTGKTLFACVRLDKGLYPSPDFVLNTVTCSRISLIAKDSTGNVATPYFDVCPSDTGSWKQVTQKLTLSTFTDPNDSTHITVTFDPAQIVAVGLQVHVGQWRAATAVPTNLPDKPQTATLHIDSIGYR
jgi:hypothetical protein